MSLSERVFRLLLRLYPPLHRADYGELMSVHFNDLLRDARQQGRWFVGWLWMRTLFDVLATAPAERLALAKEALMDTSSRSHTEPLPWWQVLLAILPGLTVLPGLPTGDFTWLAMAGIVFTIVVIAGEWYRHGRYPVWGLLMLGFVGYLLTGVVLALLNEVSLLGSNLAPVLVGLYIGGLLAAGMVIALRHGRQYGLPTSLVYLLPLMLIIALVEGTLVSGSGDLLVQSSPAALLPVLWDAALIILLLIPVALGLPLARRYGLPALIFVLGYLYPLYGFLIDPTYALGLWTDSRTLSLTAELVGPVMLLIAAPLWILRSGSPRWRSLGLLIPVAVAFVAGVVIPGSVRPYVTWTWWLRSALFALNMLLLFVVATLTYNHAFRALPADGELASPLTAD